LGQSFLVSRFGVLKLKSFRDLEVWKMSMDLAAAVYEMTSSFPQSELYGLVSQMRRAAVSIPSNIAEGQGRKNAKEFCQFLHIAKGSLAELDTQLELSRRFGFLTQNDSIEDIIKVIRVMLINLIASLQTNN